VFNSSIVRTDFFIMFSALILIQSLESAIFVLCDLFLEAAGPSVNPYVSNLPRKMARHFLWTRRQRHLVSSWFSLNFLLILRFVGLYSIFLILKTIFWGES
jgi:hypothetical protein